MNAPPLLPGRIGRILVAGTLASTLSGLVLVWRSRSDTGGLAAAVNAPSHWLWGREAIAADQIDVKHTVVGTLVHWLSGLFWALGYEALRGRRRGTVGALRDAAAITGVAAVTDLAMVPERLTPGFEHRLSRRSLCGVYASFAVGLAMAAVLTRPR